MGRIKVHLHQYPFPPAPGSEAQVPHLAILLWYDMDRDVFSQPIGVCYHAQYPQQATTSDRIKSVEMISTELQRHTRMKQAYLATGFLEFPLAKLYKVPPSNTSLIVEATPRVSKVGFRTSN